MIEDRALVNLLKERSAALDAEIAKLTKQRTLIDEMLESMNGRSEPAPERKTEPLSDTATDGPGKKSLHDRVVELVLAIIDRKRGPTAVDELWAEAQSKLDCSKQQFYTHLSSEAGRNDGPRIRRTMHGVYDKRAVARKVSVVRSPEETQKAIEQARRNARGG